MARRPEKHQRGQKIEDNLNKAETLLRAIEVIICVSPPKKNESFSDIGWKIEENRMKEFARRYMPGEEFPEAKFGAFIHPSELPYDPALYKPHSEKISAVLKLMRKQNTRGALGNNPEMWNKTSGVLFEALSEISFHLINDAGGIFTKKLEADAQMEPERHASASAAEEAAKKKELFDYGERVERRKDALQALVAEMAVALREIKTDVQNLYVGRVATQDKGRATT